MINVPSTSSAALVQMLLISFHVSILFLFITKKIFTVIVVSVYFHFATYSVKLIRYANKP